MNEIEYTIFSHEYEPADMLCGEARRINDTLKELELDQCKLVVASEMVENAIKVQKKNLAKIEDAIKLLEAQ